MNELIATLAAFTYIAAVAAMALMWVAAQEPKTKTERTAAPIIPDSRDPYIICGQGYHNQEDRITMTRAITPSAGAMYVHLSGRVYKCLRITTDGCPVMMDINNGTLLTVSSCRAYPDGKIDWHCIAEVAVC